MDHWGDLEHDKRSKGKESQSMRPGWSKKPSPYWLQTSSKNPPPHSILTDQERDLISSRLSSIQRYDLRNDDDLDLLAVSGSNWGLQHLDAFRSTALRGLPMNRIFNTGIMLAGDSGIVAFLTRELNFPQDLTVRRLLIAWEVVLQKPAKANPQTPKSKVYEFREGEQSPQFSSSPSQASVDTPCPKPRVRDTTETHEMNTKHWRESSSPSQSNKAPLKRARMIGSQQNAGRDATYPPYSSQQLLRSSIPRSSPVSGVAASTDETYGPSSSPPRPISDDGGQNSADEDKAENTVMVMWDWILRCICERLDIPSSKNFITQR